jgi:hypothetical protein
MGPVRPFMSARSVLWVSRVPSWMIFGVSFGRAASAGHPTTTRDSSDRSRA